MMDQKDFSSCDYRIGIALGHIYVVRHTKKKSKLYNPPTLLKKTMACHFAKTSISQIIFIY